MLLNYFCRYELVLFCWNNLDIQSNACNPDLYSFSWRRVYWVLPYFFNFTKSTNVDPYNEFYWDISHGCTDSLSDIFSHMLLHLICILKVLLTDGSQAVQWLRFHLNVVSTSNWQQPAIPLSCGCLTWLCFYCIPKKRAYLWCGWPATNGSWYFQYKMGSDYTQIFLSFPCGDRDLQHAEGARIVPTCHPACRKRRLMECPILPILCWRGH